MRNLMRAGWLPDQHGAWAMILAPILLGVAQSHPRPEHLLLTLGALAGFGALNAATLWWKTKRTDRYRKPTMTYLAITAAAALVLIAWHPVILLWGMFAPLSLIILATTIRKNEKSLLTRETVVLISALLAPIAFDIGVGFMHANSVWPWANPAGLGGLQSLGLQGTATNAAGKWGWSLLWANATALWLYFAGTVPYVKTLIRERRSQRWLIGSVAFHMVALGVVAALSATKLVSPWALGVWLLIALRSALMPILSNTGTRPLRAPTIGFTEVALTIALLVALLPGVLA